MNREDPYRDQAERLRQRIERSPKENNQNGAKLPPRSELHRHQQKKNKWKLKYPVIRLLALFFILLPITIFSAYTYLGKQAPLGKKESVDNAAQGYEPVQYEERKNALETDDEREAEAETDNSLDAVNGSAVTDEKKADSSPADSQSQAVSGIPSAKRQPASEQAGNKESETPAKSEVPAKAQQQVIYHTVQPSETLFRIAMKYYQSKSGIEIIKNANQIQGNEIQTGQVLKIPLQK